MATAVAQPSSALQPQLDAISARSAPFIASKLSAQEMVSYKAQFAPDRNNPYPVPAVGSVAPAFELQDSTGKSVSLQQLVDSGKHTVLLWYRGAWCPFCSATIKAYNERVGDFSAAGAQLVAITPTLPEHTAKTVDEWGLKFTVLSDVGNVVAKQYGTLNQLNEDMRNLSVRLGTDYKTLYGDKDSNLPHPGTFIVEKGTGLVSYAKVEMDYRQRVEPDELLTHIKGMGK